MISVVPLLAVAQAVEDLLEQTRVPKSALAQALIVTGSLLAVAAVAAVCLVLFRKKRRHPEHHWHARGAGPAPAADSSKNTGETGNRAERRRRRHRPRNPTLAETRGLPPVRDQQSNQPPPF